jgi:signal transduction histidine kinase
MGMVTAGMTHEIRNVLAIIRESAGLMADVLEMDREAGSPHQDKLQRGLEKIQDQVSRGIETTKRLNAFAHTVDEPWSRLECGAFLDQASILFGRWARLKKVELLSYPPEREKYVETDPFLLHLVCYYCVDFLLERAAPGDRILMWSLDDENGLAFRLESAGRVEMESGTDLLADPLELLGARLTVLDVESGGGLKLLFTG